ncbi:DUF3575 domain-containing protein [Flavobacterium sp. I-STPA6A]|jgi:hypothetical protein|uniref:DUF3575 domain-containing protein n=1 Tax=Flavobacterium sp. I-STPA6A TaxID=2590450 RepID=UPI00131C621E|nr:DUF3575 domain-containing protein [Flavobacterium sp. I-STPA6A]
MKKFLIIFVLITYSSISAQTYVKANAFTTILTIPNVGIETSIGKKSTFHFDALASFWKSVNGKPREFYTFTPEYRYHFKEKYNGFYAGAHIGASIFNFQKWNYLNTNNYEKGVGYFAGATIGYQVKVSEKFMIDCFLGGGWHQGFYKGYDLYTGERYEPAKKYNKSGESLPYRGGVMISYKIN